MTVAQQLAAFLTATSADTLPSQALDHAAMLVASTMASAACGASLESATIIRDLARERGGRQDASVWFAGDRLPVAEAAQVNAVMSDAAASDDSDLRNIVHCGTPLTAASLAMAEHTGASGEAVLRAIVVGYEAAGRISAAITPGFRDRGFHGCVGAVFAAATSSSMLLRLDAARLAQAIALAATSIGGLATAADTSVAREYHAGLATLLGVNAAQAASRGYRVELAILEARRGFFEAFGGADGAAAGAAALAGLSESWDIVTDMAIKLVPGGHPYHAIAEAAANAAQAGDIAAADIISIVIARPGMTALTGPLHPRNLIDMAHSPAYFAAAGAADRTFAWQHAGSEKIADPVIHRLIDLVRVGDPPPGADAAAYRQGATVTIQSHDGRAATSTVLVPKGAGALGIAWDDVDAKYRALMPASGLAAPAIEASLAIIHALRSAADVTGLIRAVTGS
ncbi:MAG TPA: MmgE/PrpD family protein [Acetobacteraceae bacterium]|nr:MmgE/PrpD family protein [Acetobacteraceae bacterium]